MTSVLFGHQGGWDEALLVLVPIGLFAGLLWLANKRARAVQAKRRSEQDGNGTTSSHRPETPTTSADS